MHDSDDSQPDNDSISIRYRRYQRDRKLEHSKSDIGRISLSIMIHINNVSIMQTYRITASVQYPVQMK